MNGLREYSKSVNHESGWVGKKHSCSQVADALAEAQAMAHVLTQRLTNVIQVYATYSSLSGFITILPH